MRTSTTSFSVLVLATFAASSFCAAAILNVPTDHADIATALTAAVAGDEVVVAAGTYLEHDLILPSGVVLRGATGDPADVTIDSQRAGRCVFGTNLDAATRLEALTLTNGLSSLSSTGFTSWGGGLMVDSGALTVANCVFSTNEAAIGGGAWVTGTGTPTFVDCIFDGNAATESAGMILRGTCSPVLQNCVFRNATDRIMYGGGLTWVGTGQALLEDCTVEDNAVLESGGGVEVFGSGATATLRNCVIRRNTAGLYAGGMDASLSSHVILENCEITDNGAGSSGGGVNLGSGVVLEAFISTILNNTAPSGPDGVVGSSASATLTCCTIDLAAWNALGTLTIDDANCTVATEPSTWGGVKAIFR